MKMRQVLIWIFITSILACAHQPASLMEAKTVASNQLARSELSNWTDFLSSLESMSAKELKSECEKWRKDTVRSWDEELRYALVTAFQQQKVHNYQKAAEVLNAAWPRVQGSAELKNFFRIYIQQNNALAALERDLLEERRLRGELDKKLKALSDIEREMSERQTQSEVK